MLKAEETVLSSSLCEEVPSINSSIEIIQQSRRKKDLSYARYVHLKLCEYGIETHIVLGNRVVPMFAECGSILDAQQAFDRISVRNEFCWTSLIEAYIDNGKLDHALYLYETMQDYSVSPSRFTYMSLLKACGRSKCIDKGQELHAEMSDNGLSLDIFLGNTLIDMYAKCGCFEKALESFDQLPCPDVVSWTALISGYIEHGFFIEALNCFEKMEVSNAVPDVITYNCILKGLSISRDIECGWQMHAKIIKNGLEVDLSLCSSLVDMYIRCGLLERSHNVFNSSPIQNIALWNALISGYVESGFIQEALVCFEKMQSQHVSPDGVTYLYCLKACGAIKNIEKGRELHSMIPEEVFKKHPYLRNALVDLYAKCGSLQEAHEVLREHPLRDVVSWNTLINGYVQCGLGKEALKCFHEMQLDGVHPNTITVVCALKACSALGDISEGLHLHNEVSLWALETDLPAANSLIDMYARCGYLGEAQAVFGNMLVRDEVTWTTLIAGYAEEGLGENALEHLKQMQLEGFIPTAVTLVCSLKACISIGAIDKGQQIHAEIVKEGFETNVFIGNVLVDVYSKYGMLVDAADILDTLTARDIVTWNSLIAGYVEHGRDEEALNCLLEMQIEGIPPDPITMLCALKACGTIKSSYSSHNIHDEIIVKGFENESHIKNILVDTYAKCGCFSDAECLLIRMQVRDIVAWTALIGGYVEQGLGNKALDCYQLMLLEKIPSDEVAFVCGLKACGNITSLNDGQKLYIEIVKRGVEQEVQIGNSLIDMYVKCGSLIEAQGVFDKLQRRDAISWTTLISGYSENGISEQALRGLELMSLEGISPDVIALTRCLEACTTVGLITTGQELHIEVIEKGYETDHYVGSTLVGMYGKFGFYEEANVMFDKLLVQDRASWNALILGYADNGIGQEALRCLQEMQYHDITPDNASWNAVIWGFAKQEDTDKTFEVLGCLLDQGFLPNTVIMASLLKACGSPLACENAKRLHAQAYTVGDFEAGFSMALLDIYSKYGSMVDAQYVFDAMPRKSLAAWNTFIAGNARIGQSDVVFLLFERMKYEGTRPNDITFLSLLTTCCHTGLLEKGQYYFKAMTKDYDDIVPSIQHYTCMIDLLGRAGLVDEAINMMKTMPFVPDFAVWSTIIGACQKWGNVEIGSKAFEEVRKLEGL